MVINLGSRPTQRADGVCPWTPKTHTSSWTVRKRDRIPSPLTLRTEAIKPAVPDDMKRQRVMTQPEIGKLVRSLRLETGLTQEQFAAQLGVTFPTVNRWENNRAKPSPLAVEKIEKMVRRLGTRGQELLASS